MATHQQFSLTWSWTQACDDRDQWALITQYNNIPRTWPTSCIHTCTVICTSRVIPGHTLTYNYDVISLWQRLFVTAMHGCEGAKTIFDIIVFFYHVFRLLHTNQPSSYGQLILCYHHEIQGKCFTRNVNHVWSDWILDTASDWLYSLLESICKLLLHGLWCTVCHQPSLTSTALNVDNNYLSVLRHLTCVWVKHCL